jgi:hypothetical protein
LLCADRDSDDGDEEQRAENRPFHGEASTLILSDVPVRINGTNGLSVFCRQHFNDPARRQESCFGY